MRCRGDICSGVEIYSSKMYCCSKSIVNETCRVAGADPIPFCSECYFERLTMPAAQMPSARRLSPQKNKTSQNFATLTKIVAWSLVFPQSLPKTGRFSRLGCCGCSINWNVVFPLLRGVDRLLPRRDLGGQILVPGCRYFCDSLFRRRSSSILGGNHCEPKCPRWRIPKAVYWRKLKTW